MSTVSHDDPDAPTVEVRIDLGAEHGPDEILAPEGPFTGGEDDHPIATAPLPGYGTE